MAQSVPMVRSMSLVPAIRWLLANGHAAEPLLKPLGLASAPYGDPLRPVPLLHVGALLRAIAEKEGPDIPSRIVSEASTMELAMLGSVALGTRTPVEAVHRISAALPLFCSHEYLSIRVDLTQVDIWHSYAVKFEPETEHLMLQYAVAMTDRLIAMTGALAPRLARVEIPRHPEFGLNHLRPWFGDGIEPSAGHGLRISMQRALAESPFPNVARDRMLAQTLPEVTPIRGEGSFGDSVRIMLTSMLVDATPTIGHMASACGTSVRTLQRRLSQEGLSFSGLVEEVRRAKALELIARPNTTAKSTSTEVGYRHQSSLTRAMLRWTGAGPKRFREG